jgi:hypothetical protein
MANSYDTWIQDVGAALRSINMPMEDWQKSWAFDFRSEFSAGTPANDAAMKANKYWWYRQNQPMGQDCQKTANCLPPCNHSGDCELVR